MELTQLRYFVRLAQILNFTEASRSLFITQSTLSISIKQLEDELGTKLFDRIGKKVYLTEDGSILYKHTLLAMTSLSDGIQEINIRKQIFKGTISVGVTYTTSHFLNSIIVDYSRKYPEVKLIINMYNTVDEAVSELLHNNVDLLIAYRQNRELPSLCSVDMFDSPVCAVMHRDHPLASRKTVGFQDMKLFPMVTFLKGTHTRTVVNRLLHKNNLHLEPSIEVNDTNVILDLVKTSRWFSILSPMSIQSFPELVSVPIDGKPEYLSVCVMWQKNRNNQSLLKSLLNELLHEKSQ